MEYILIIRKNYMYFVLLCKTKSKNVFQCKDFIYLCLNIFSFFAILWTLSGWVTIFGKFGKSVESRLQICKFCHCRLITIHTMVSIFLYTSVPLFENSLTIILYVYICVIWKANCLTLSQNILFCLIWSNPYFFFIYFVHMSLKPWQ